MNPYSTPSLPWTPTDYENALCRGEEYDLFFPDPTDTATAEKAKSICAGCEHKSQCREDARKRNEPYGVFGGESEQERRTWKRRAHRGQPHPLGINQINAPKVVALRKQGLRNYVIAQALGINGKGVDRALEHAKRTGLLA